MKTPSRSTIAISAATLLASAGIAIALRPPLSQAASPLPAAKPALTVTATHPRRIALPIELHANGFIAAYEEAIIGNEIGGLKLTRLHANVGDRVRAGQVLASFSSEAVEVDLAQARAALDEARANAKAAADNAQRARNVQRGGALSEQQLADYLTSAMTAEARLHSAEAALATQQLRLKYAVLKAPDDGIISSRTATVGAVPAMGTELFRMVRKGRLEWRAEVTATELGKIIRDTKVTLTAANGNTVTGTVRALAPTLDTRTGNALVYVDLPQNSAGITAGMYASGRFNLGHSDGLIIPQPAVQVRDGFSYVFRLAPDGHVSKTPVQPARRQGDQVELLSGATPDDLLVVNGAGFLNDGDLVRQVRP